ncbi:MAG: LuxR C-terminal-related transcriptional regulator [Oligoflexales bacterium]
MNQNKKISYKNSSREKSEEEDRLQVDSPLVKIYLNKKELLEGLSLYLNNDNEVIDHVWKNISSGHVWHDVIEKHLNKGIESWSQTSVFPLNDILGAIVGYMALKADVTGKVETNNENKRVTVQLEYEQEKLLKSQHALNGVLEHLNDEKLKTLQKIKENLEVSIFPLLGQIMKVYPKDDKYLQVLKQNLENIAKPIFDETRNWKSKLTSKEMQICTLIKQGFVIKEIAPCLHLSPRTVEKHRENIRKKLGLTDRKMSLNAYLIEQSAPK